MIRIIYRSSSSACFELDGDTRYYAGSGYAVLVDGEERFRRDTNVFSLYGLKPDSRYEVTVRFENGEEERAELETPGETCCVNVRDFGAAGDGIHEDTAAIQAAISFLPEGGRLWFPAGTYLTLPLSLKSHITLDLDEGAVILGSTQRERYPIIPSTSVDPVTGAQTPQTSFEGLEIAAYQSLLQASYAEDIAIVGRGTIDGNGQNGDWWKDFSVSFAEDARPGKPSMKNQNADQCRLGLYLDNVRKIRVKNVKLQGVEGAALVASHYEEVSTEDFEEYG